MIVRATSAPLTVIDCENAWLRVSIDFSASAVTRSMSAVSWLVLAPIASTSEPRLAVDHLRQPVGLLLDIGDDFVGLAGHGRAERAAGGEHRAFDFGRGRLDLGAHFVGGGNQRALGVLRAGLDIVGGVGGDRGERPLDVGGDRLDLAGGISRGRGQRTLRLARAAEDGRGGIRADRLSVRSTSVASA